MSHDALGRRLDRLTRALAPNLAGGDDVAYDEAAEAYLRACFGGDPIFAPHLDALCAALLSSQPRYDFTTSTCHARDDPNSSQEDHYFVFWQRARAAAPPVVIVISEG